MNYEKTGDGSLKEFGDKARCPVCKKMRWKFLIANVDTITLTDKKWACGSCWKKWQDELAALEPGADYLTDAEWLAQFAEQRGVSGDDLVSLRAIADRSVSRLEQIARSDEARGSRKAGEILKRIEGRR